MKYSICVESIYKNLSIYERIEKIIQSKPEAIEFWDLSKYDRKKIAQLVSKYKLKVTDCCCNDQWAVRLSCSFKAVKDKYLETLNTAREVGCNTIIMMAGDVDSSKYDTNKGIMCENLKRLADILEKEDSYVLIEPLNSMYDHKGVALDNAYDGFEIMRIVDSPRVKLLFDCYHMQIMQGNLINTLVENIEYVGHIHSAGVPGRGELHLGEINYPRIIKILEENGYDGYFGLEYFPSYDSTASLRDTFKYIRDELKE